MVRQQALGIAGSVRTTVLVTRGQERPLTITSTSSSANVTKNAGSMRERAVLDAMAQYKYKKGDTVTGSDELRRLMQGQQIRTQIVRQTYDYGMSKQFFRIKRENWKGKYVTVVRNKKTGRFVSTRKWSSKV